MKLDELREKIDGVDRKILDLLSKRAGFVKQVGSLKVKTGTDFYVPHREKKILASIVKNNPGPLPAASVAAIYREILNACRSLESRIKVAYFGPEATFTHQAALKNFGAGANLIPVASITDVFTEVGKNRADYGVVPVENSTEGMVSHTLDMFIDSDLRICSEISMQIELCLLARVSKLSDIKRVCSFSQPLGQCRNWLEEMLPGIPVIETSSTAEAARRAATEKGTAAVASQAAAVLYNLDVLVRGIEDSKENFTRFLIIGRSQAMPSGQDKTSALLSIKDKVGALHDILTAFKRNGINLTKIESRPTKKRAWEYIFFVDFEGHVNDPRVQKCLKQLEPHCVFLKVLGSYPRAE